MRPAFLKGWPSNLQQIASFKKKERKITGHPLRPADLKFLVRSWSLIFITPSKKKKEYSEHIRSLRATVLHPCGITSVSRGAGSHTQG